MSILFSELQLPAYLNMLSCGKNILSSCGYIVKAELRNAFLYANAGSIL